MLLDDVIRMHLPILYKGYTIVSAYAIRITRDARLTMRERPADVLASMEESLRERGLGAAVRLQHDEDLPSRILATLLGELELAAEDLYAGKGFTAFSDLLQLHAAVDAPRLKDQPSLPHPGAGVRGAPDVWSADARRRHPRAPPVPQLRRGHPLRARCRRRPSGPGHQDDALPCQSGLAHRPCLAHGGRERQGGRRPRGAAGALRRGRRISTGPARSRRWALT